VDLPPIIEDVDEPKEKKRSSLPWIVGGSCTVFFIAGVIGFIILCGFLFEICEVFGRLPA
jgi:hypothetical protein